MSSNGQLSPLFVNVVAGGGAGLIETIATYPIDLVKTRIQLLRGPLLSKVFFESLISLN
jgi:hypothetical protein